MQNQITTYLAIDKDLLRAGLKEVLESNFNVDVISISRDKDLTEKLDHKTLTPQILVYHQDVKPWECRFLSEVLKNNSHIKPLIITGDINFKNIKFLFNIGAHGIINQDDSSEEFIKLFNKILNNKKCLGKDYKQLVMDELYKVNKNFSVNRPGQNGAQKICKDDEKSFYQMSDCFDLTKREREVLCLICDGFSTEEIASELFISTYTAGTHRKNLLKKMGVKNTAEMVKTAILSKLIA